MTNSKNLYNNELTPGQIKDLGASSFYRISVKPDTSRQDIDMLRKWMSECFLNPFSVRKNYTREYFKKTGSMTGQGYVIYVSDSTDCLTLKLKFGEYLE
jgi:hypothetical protein